MIDADLRYEPPQNGYDWLVRLKLASCLVIGEVADKDRDEIGAAAPEVRRIPPSTFSSMMHKGVYAFHQADGWHAVVVAAGRDPRESDHARSRYTEDGHLVVARALHEDRWESAGPYAGQARFTTGDMVRPKGSDIVGRVIGVRSTAAGYQCDVNMRGEVKRYNEHALDLVEGDPADPRFWLSRPPAPAADISLTLTWTKLRHPLTDMLYSFASSKTVFRAYQFKPVLKVLTASSGRLLIADEVGLGKTIEAGLIWSELEQRAHLERALVSRRPR